MTEILLRRTKNSQVIYIYPSEAIFENVPYFGMMINIPAIPALQEKQVKENMHLLQDFR